MRRAGILLYARSYKPRGFWLDFNNQRQFMDDILEKEGITSDQEKLQYLNVSLVRKHGGYSLVNAYPSFQHALKKIYPEIQWPNLPPTAPHTNKNPKNNALDIKEHRYALENIRKQLGIELEGFYTLFESKLREHGGSNILRYYPSYMECIMKVYPEYKWDKFAFKHKPKTFWKSIPIQKELMQKLEQQFQIKQPKEWLNVNIDLFRSHGGYAIFRLYPSFIDLLKSIYPQEPWDSFHQQVTHYWEDKTNVKKFLDAFAIKNSIKQAKDWLMVSHFSIKKVPGGSGLLAWYKYSLPRMLEDSYPDIDWTDLKAQAQHKKTSASVNPPLDPDEARRVFDNIGKELGVVSMKDWYKVSVSSIKERTNIIRKFSNKLECFQFIYPEYEWNVLMFDRIPNRCWQDKKVQKQFFEHVKEELKISTKELLTVPLKKYFELGGTGLMKANNSRKFDLICDIYPELKEIEELKPGYWKSKENQRKWIETVQVQLGIQSPEDWAKVTIRAFNELGGSPLLNIYSSIRNTMISLYPDIDWSHLHQHVPNGYWKSPENQRRFFEEILRKENLQSLADLKTLSRQKLVEYGGSSLLNYFPSYYDCLVAVYPEENWDIFEFPILPRSFWEKKTNHRKFLDRMAKRKNLKTPEDWAVVTVEDIKREKGIQLLRKYSSFYDALRENYPEHDWDVFTSRKTVPRNYWKSDVNCKKFLEAFVKEFDIKEPSDWNRISKVDIIRFGGSGLLYQTGINSILKKYFPDIPWKNLLEPNRLPAGHWEDMENVRNFVASFERKYRIQYPQDWVRVSSKQIIEEGGQSLLRTFNGMYNLLKTIYPEEEWNEASFRIRDKRSVQRLLFLLVQEIFDNMEIVEEFIHDGLTRKLGRAIEFDIYIPEYNIGIEYHGKHHYADIPSFGLLEMYQNRDLEKEKLCEDNEITLIVIPFWWNNNKDSLQGTLARKLGARFPHLFPRPHCASIADI